MENFDLKTYDYSVLEKYVSASEFQAYIKSKVSKDLEVIDEMYDSSIDLRKLPQIDILAHAKELNLSEEFYKSLNYVYSMNIFLTILSKDETEPSKGIVDYIESEFSTMSDFMEMINQALSYQQDEKFIVMHVDDDEFISFNLEDGVGKYTNQSRILAVINIEPDLLKLLKVSKSKYIQLIWDHFDWDEFTKRVRCDLCDGCA